MSNLDFQLQQNGTYAAEVKVTGDFNLHVETKNGGVVSVYQRSSDSGEYAVAKTFNSYKPQVIDCDFAALVYPKWIKVVSGSEVVSASVNFNVGVGSGSGEGSGDEHVIYYSFGEPVYGYKFQEYGITPITHVRAEYNGKYMYGSYLEVEMKFGEMTISAYPDACMFSPMTVRVSGGDWVTYTCYEDVVKDYPNLPTATRITAEEYWKYFNAE